MRSILIGNGINARLKIEQLKTERINNRFILNSKRYTPLLSSVFSNQINENDIYNIIDKTQKDIGLEILARILYDYIKNVTICEKKTWSDNDEHRIQDIITCIAIGSIFYEKSGLIQPKVDQTLLPDFSKYEKVFTLNYHEFWDGYANCISLHGRIDYNTLENKTDAFLYNYKRMNLDEYKEGVERMKLNGNAVSFNSSEYVFAPKGVNKCKLTCIAGIFPSDKLHPAEDLYLINPKNLYEELRGISELDIFGVSPYGDDDLIGVINDIKQVKVYIHEINNSPEKEEWERKLKKCAHSFEDAANLKRMD